MKPVLVSPSDVPAVWPDLSGYLTEALDCASGELDAGQLRLLLLRGEAKLVALVEGEDVKGALAIEFTDYPNYRVGHIIAAGGTGLTLEGEAWDQVKAWLRSDGCRYVEAFTGESRARLFKRLGLETVYQVVRSEL